MITQRMSWDEIKTKYPHQNVGLIDCQPDSYDIKSAIVKYTDKDLSYQDLIKKAMLGEIHLMYTTMDEDDGIVL